MNLTRCRMPLTLTLSLTAAVALTSCTQTAAPSAATSAAPTTPSAPGTTHQPVPAPSVSAPSVSASTATGRRIDITVSGKHVTPAPGVVNLAVGESLTIAVTSDHDDQLHAHGFEVEKDIKAGTSTEFTVKGTQTGVFDVELHDPELRILQVAVR